MNELQNYRDLLNIRTAIEPEDVKGRAVISYGEFAVEMQTALPFDAVNESQMYSKLKQTYRKMRFYYGENQKESTVREDRKNILIEKKTEKESGRLPERIPVFEGARDRKEWLSLGTSLYDERKQGFLLKETKRIFIGSETKTSLESVIENGIIMENWELYRFSLEPESKKFWHEIRTEEEIGRFLQRCLEQKKQKRILLYIDDFSDFYDTISDEDLVVFGKYLKTQKQEQLLIITQGIFKKLSEYKDTGLYVYLVRCEDGMIMDGGIDNSKIMFLNNTVSRSDPEVRKKQLERNQAILYHGDTLAYIKLGEKMRKQECVIKVPGLNEKFRFKVPDHMSIAEVISLLAVLIKEEYPEAEIQAESMELYQARTGKKADRTQCLAELEISEQEEWILA